MADMDLNFTHDYNGPAEKVAELLRTKEFIDDVAAHAGAQSHDVRIEGNTTHLDMALPTPANIAKFVGSTIKLTQTMSFTDPAADGSRRGQVKVDVAGAPVSVDLASLLKPVTDTTSQATYTGTLNVKIPLVGRKVEAQIEPMIREAFAGIERRANAWLA